MAADCVSATTLITAAAEAIFAVLADPAQHAAIDCTGWVCAPRDSQPLTTTDWSAVPDALREHIGFPPFPPEHLGNALAHLTGLVT